jgi:sulfatase maturation enzyme AslB (radical SAM superfamily)
MANQQIFCNTPWYEAHIYWDGSLGICCQESRKLHFDHQKYNIKNMTLREWFNSEPVRQLRKEVLSDTTTDICSQCYHEEDMHGTSRRHKANQKSVIFTHSAFQNSYKQSPGYNHFELSQQQDGITDTLPIDLHIDLGNYCNLACKMCWSGASSRIATQYVRWGHENHRQYLGTDWTKDSITWNRFLDELVTIPKLKNVHLMGGETLLTPRFEELVDFMISHNRFDICFSFVTNGTVFNDSLMDKLSQFSRVGIEVSIETTTPHNDYVRQGTNTALIIKNIEKYQKICNDKVSVTLRPAISALTIGYYYSLLEYCLENKLIIKSLLVTAPSYLNANVLPEAIKMQYLIKYQDMLNSMPDNNNKNYNESDPNNYVILIRAQVQQAINILKQPPPNDQKELLNSMVKMCRQWDNEFGFNAIDLYPELTEVFVRNGY